MIFLIRIYSRFFADAVIGTHSRVYDPVLSAAIAAESKTRELCSVLDTLTLISDSPGEPEQQRLTNSDKLTSLLHAILDSQVGGGTAAYAPFLDPFLIRVRPEAQDSVNKLLDSMQRQVVAVEKGLGVHSRVVQPELKPLHENLVNGGSSCNRAVYID